MKSSRVLACTLRAIEDVENKEVRSLGETIVRKIVHLFVEVFLHENMTKRSRKSVRSAVRTRSTYTLPRGLLFRGEITYQAHQKRQVHGKKKISDQRKTNALHAFLEKEPRPRPQIKRALYSEKDPIKAPIQEERVADHHQQKKLRHNPTHQL